MKKNTKLNKMTTNFLNTLKANNYPFNQNIVIFDIGSRDCMQSIEFANAFPNATIFAFECNPNTLPLCRKNIKPYKNIVLIDQAVNLYDGECTFYPINKEKTITSWADGNQGASSLFKANGKYDIEQYVQDEVHVNCVRLDTVLKTHHIEKVDLIWMDLQGSELLALKSLGNHLADVQYIHTEISHIAIYEGQVMFNELNSYLENFTQINELKMTGWQEDAIYKNNH